MTKPYLILPFSRITRLLMHHVWGDTITARVTLGSVLLAVSAVLGLGSLSSWVVERERQAAYVALVENDLEGQRTILQNRLRSISDRMQTFADSHLLTTALLDSADREQYLIPFLQSMRQIDDVPVDIILTDFEGKVIADNGKSGFTPADLQWLVEQLRQSKPSTTFFKHRQWSYILVTHPLIYARTESVQGGVFYKVRLEHLAHHLKVKLEPWHLKEAKHAQQKTGLIYQTIMNGEGVFSSLQFLLTEDDEFLPTRKPEYHAYVVYGFFSLIAIAVIVLTGRYLASVLTRDVQQLEHFSKVMVHEGISEYRLKSMSTRDLQTVAQSINLMLDRIDQQQKQLRLDSERQFRTLFEEMFTGFALHEIVTCQDGQGLTYRFVEVNREAQRVLGLSRDVLLGKTAEELGIIVPSHVLESYIAVAFEGKSTEFELFNPVNDSLLEVRAFSPRMGQFATLFLDVTERKQAQTKLLHALEEAQEAAKSKSAFLAMMSHEIRTPLNGIIGMAELLQESALMPEDREFVDIIKSSADALLVIINDVLDFSKIEAGKVSLEYIPFDVIDMIDSVVAILMQSAHAKSIGLNVVIDPETPSVIQGDPARLRQVLWNLVGNAIKFTEHGQVEIRVQMETLLDAKTELSHRLLTIAVADSGIGMTTEQLRRLFSPFTQADAFITRRFGGTGLGLSISNSLVQLMGGNILVRSEPGQGSTFTVRIPTVLVDNPLAVTPV